ncbi:hypothetical protein [Niallia endozanthoxylica]|uniref:hypothetical protein n=1 Tax=Niallia endozanthoxylica TaxID=2036016 RepID=UPI00168BB1DC|nr:hypothetical protein [Niallia endozanthoxylica]
MWVITIFSNSETISMLEFEEEEEARQAFKEIEDYKILTELVDYNVPSKIS